MTAFDYGDVLEIYSGANGKATRQLYEDLLLLGPVGEVAVNIFRACKASERAKAYRRARSTRLAYDKKQWSMDNLVKTLSKHGEALGITWGWGEDPEQPFHTIVLYIDLPTGQVSFHTKFKGQGPDYPGTWDGVKNEGPMRICKWIASLEKKEVEA